MAERPGAPPSVALEAALKQSEKPPADTPIVRGYEFVQGQPVDYNRLLEAMATTGFQAANFGAAVNEVNRMVFTLLLSPLYTCRPTDLRIVLEKSGTYLCSCSSQESTRV